MEELIQQTQSALPTLQSKRLILNCFKSADAKETYASITPSLTRFMAWDAPESEQEFTTVWKNWLENMTDHKEYVFVIRHIETQEFIGLCGLHRLHDEIPEVGIWIRETAHGHHYGHEAVHCVVVYAFNTLGIQVLSYPVAEENWASRKIAERLGGKIIRYIDKPKYRAVMYEILAENFVF
ncbi:GNAT family N-acetyltransferase [Acinetobacter sp. AS5]|uniref:GNAT family N-acetyltransferase n=1 Tax=Acinetobacter sp. AS5 TaxID=3029187 RepID=UPI003B82B896